MKANAIPLPLGRQRGFSAFELVVVVAVISLLGLFVANRFRQLLVDVERSKMELQLTTIKTALSLQAAKYFATGNRAELEQLIAGNPMSLLEKKPDNYLGVINQNNMRQVKKGSWFYDEYTGTLVYLVKNGGYLSTPFVNPERVCFKVQPVYAAGGASTNKKIHKPSLSGVTLKTLKPYCWLRQ